MNPFPLGRRARPVIACAQRRCARFRVSAGRRLSLIRRAQGGSMPSGGSELRPIVEPLGLLRQRNAKGNAVELARDLLVVDADIEAVHEPVSKQPKHRLTRDVF
jgi:hypothetical protein